MKNRLVLTVVATAIAFYSGSLAQAACLGNGATPIVAGPLNPVDGFPEFVTDSTGRSMQRCLDPVLCFFDPVVASDPFSVQIGSGGEAFYWSATATLNDAAGSKVTLVMAAETAFLQVDPNTGAPINGSQFPFLRLRLVVKAAAAGTYTLVHPYGTENFTVDVASGGRDVFNTIDVGFAPNATVNGPVGPFLVWNAGAPAGFAGASGVLHAVTGSPCATNSVTLTGRDLLGNRLNLDGRGGNVLTTNLFDVQGRLFDGKVQTPLTASRLTYSRPLGGLGQIDTFATSTATASVSVMDGPTIPAGSSRIPLPVTLGRAASALGGAIDSASIAVTGVDTPALPPVLAVTASEPGLAPVSDPTTLVHPLVDFVKISQADYNPVTQTLLVLAASGDLNLPPTLTISEYGSAPGLPITTVAPPATVTVVSSAGGSDTAQVRVFTPVPPLAPSGLVAGAVTTTSVTLNWTDASTDETAFDIYRNAVKVGSVGPNITTFTDIGLTAATAYTYQVFAVNAAGQTGSNTLVATTASLAPPLAPTLATAAATPARVVTLGWVDNAADETGYQVLRSLAATGPFAQVATAAANATSATDTTALPGTTYFYQVVAVRGTVPSTPATATLTTPALPSASTAVTAVAAASGTSVTVTWADANTNETGFQVMRSTAGGAFAAVGGVLAANSTSFVDTTALPSTTYTYRVDVSNWAGTTASAASAAVTTPAGTTAPVVAPTAATATATPARTVTLGWTDNSADETGFIVLRSTSATGVFAQVATAAANATTAADTTALPATTYFYQVIAVRGTTRSTAATASLTTPALPSASTGVTAVAAASGTSVTVNWADANTNETGFQVMRRIGTGAFAAVGGVLPANSTSFVDATAVPGTTYSYRVDVSNWAGTTASAISAAVTTPGAAAVTLLAPTGLVATSGTNPVLTWTDASTGETTYRVRRSLVTVSATGSVTIGTPTTLTNTLPANTTTFTDNTANANATYRYEVAARNGTTVGPVATVFAVDTLGGLPAVARPTLARALVGTTARVTVNWTAPTPGISIGGYEVQRCTGTACTTFAKLTGTAVNSAGTVDGRATLSFADNTVARRTTYVYRLRAVGGAGTGLVGGFSGTGTVTTP
ncbi:MAG: hypothetical protein RLZZ584_1524 [Pseudomonadota bacterium]